MLTNNRNPLILSITKSSQKGIDWENILKKEKKQFFDQSRIRQPSIQFDSLSTTLKIDSKLFVKFVVTGKENGKIVRNHVQLSSNINGYRFHIVYEFIDKEFQEQIEKSIMNGKFIP